MTRRDDIFCNEVQGHKFMSQTFYANMLSMNIILLVRYMEICISISNSPFKKFIHICNFKLIGKNLNTKRATQYPLYIVRIRTEIPKNLIKDALKKEWINFNLMQVGCNMLLFLLCLCILMHDLFLLYSCKIFLLCFN